MTTPDLQSAIPKPPKALATFLEKAAAQRVSTRELTKSVSALRGTAGFIKRVAESKEIGRGKRFLSMEEAAFAMGGRSVRNLTIVHQVKQLAQRMKPDHLDLNAFWGHTVRRATAATLLAQHMNFDAPSEAFAMGFLLDIACLSMPTLMPEGAESYAKIFEVPSAMRIEQEREIFGRDHMTAFEDLRLDWGLPGDIADIVARHHDPDPETSGRRHDRLLLLAHVADAVVDVYQTNGHPDAVNFAKAQLERATQRVPLKLIDLCYQIEALIDEVGKLLDIPVKPRADIFIDLDEERTPIDPKKDEVVQLKMELRKVRKERKQLNQVLNRLTGEMETNGNLDALTGACNRTFLLQSLGALLDHCRDKNWPLSVVIFDVDRMVEVNRIHGLLAGDAVLKRITERCVGLFRPSDVFGRIDGDRFAVLMPRTPTDGGVIAGRRLKEAVSRAPFQIGSVDVDVTASVGGTTFRSSAPVGASVDSLINRAEAALHHAKGVGGDKLIWGN